MTVLDTTAGLPADPQRERAAPAGERLTRRQGLLLVLLLGTQFMLAVDFSILNVALPAVGRGVGLADHDLAWVATAFALPAAGLTLLFGRVADLFGRRSLFLAGLALLAAGSLVGGLAGSPAVLLGARVVQGLAAAMATPAALSLLTTSFPEGPLRRRALGLNGALLSGGFTVGALLGGLLTSALSWRWAFLVNVPVAIAVLAAVPRVVPAGRPEGARPRLDVPGAASVTGGLLALVYGLTSAGRDGWGDPRTLLALAAAAALLAVFVAVERRAAEPLVALPVLRRRTVAWGNTGLFLVFSLESSVVFVMTLYAQDVLGFSALATGLAFGLPGTAAVLAGMVAPRVLGRLGVARTLAVGLLVQGLANAPLLLVGLHRWGLVLLAGVLFAGFFGHVSAIVAATVTATSGLPDDEQGLATGLTTLTQQVGITLGIPLLGAVLTARRGALDALPPREALLGGVHAALLVDVVATLAGAVVVGAALRRR
ncbi:putative MFS family arabinose efflux permease [Motilibacter rhizosphaerae]|uniref:Putative MFS family arabinose efflux permease n=1 Tax=Motilibacter rhizosphaerae TaxID=598652 RepID=A0A4Q7NQF6_9ACTN|nr:MFS transporter [Motilibacter rhizosphaerae]RZS87529.1 putative MFS family arabinose efflux permease [Motilibacter rhizosphaerae]